MKRQLFVVVLLFLLIHLYKNQDTLPEHVYSTNVRINRVPFSSDTFPS